MQANPHTPRITVDSGFASGPGDQAGALALALWSQRTLTRP